MLNCTIFTINCLLIATSAFSESAAMCTGSSPYLRRQSRRIDFWLALAIRRQSYSYRWSSWIWQLSSLASICMLMSWAASTREHILPRTSPCSGRSPIALLAVYLKRWCTGSTLHCLSCAAFRSSSSGSVLPLAKHMSSVASA